MFCKVAQAGSLSSVNSLLVRLLPLILFGLALLTSSVYGQESPTSEVIWLTGQELDMGEVAIRTEHTAWFPFQNKSTSPLVIETIRTSCGCTAPDWSATPVLPGGNR